ncbi:MAG TPA: argininosuccinate lyase [Nitriliruptorales bacterium]|nr:argininosuccinate lyase [Nitriliruptorales bacterium]
MTDADATAAGRLWGGRLSEPPAEAAWQLGVSTAFDRRLWRQDIASSKAHARELARIGVLDDDEATALVDALDECARLFQRGAFAWEVTDEDLHGAIERWLVERLGAVGGKLRAGRSRNDQVANDLRLWVRTACGELRGDVADLQEALADQAEAHLGWVAPGYTHLQRGQPVLLSHHLLAYVWMLDRDAGRLRDCAGRADESVLGAAAMAGTTLPLDPARYAAALGYARIAANSIDAVASRDFALELLATGAILATNMSRLAEELVLWSSAEFGFVRLADGFSTGSSIMPQKRNPDVAELVRGKAGRVIGHLVGLLATVKALPLTYNRDLQEDKPPVFDAVDTLRLALQALTGAVASSTFDRERLEAAAAGGSSLATDLAEEMVRRGVPFREAHEVVGQLVRRAEQRDGDLDVLGPEEVAGAHPVLDRSVVELLDVHAAVERRSSTLGTATSSVAAQLAAARRAIAANRDEESDG